MRIRLRNSAAIQRAHDILWEVVDRNVPIFEGQRLLSFLSALDTLCWVLHHDHSPDFAENLAKVVAAIFGARIPVA